MLAFGWRTISAGRFYFVKQWLAWYLFPRNGKRAPERSFGTQRKKPEPKSPSSSKVPVFLCYVVANSPSNNHLVCTRCPPVSSLPQSDLPLSPGVSHYRVTNMPQYSTLGRSRSGGVEAAILSDASTPFSGVRSARESGGGGGRPHSRQVVRGGAVGREGGAFSPRSSYSSPAIFFLADA